MRKEQSKLTVALFTSGSQGGKMSLTQADETSNMGLEGPGWLALPVENGFLIYETDDLTDGIADAIEDLIPWHQRDRWFVTAQSDGSWLLERP